MATIRIQNLYFNSNHQKKIQIIIFRLPNFKPNDEIKITKIKGNLKPFQKTFWDLKFVKTCEEVVECYKLDV